MSISSSLLISQSGLRATELRAGLVSANIANAQTEGYVRRGVEQTSVGAGGDGRTVDVQVVRRVDERLVGMSRSAQSDVSYHETRAEMLNSYLTSLGEPNDALSPAARLSTFTAGMDLLMNNPADTSVQRDVLNRADGLVRSLNDASMNLDQVRASTRDDTFTRVEQVNRSLQTLAQLNAQITPGSSIGSSPDIMDQVSLELSRLSEHMDITARYDATGRVNVQTGEGTELLVQTDAVEVSFVGLTIMAGDIDITPARDGARGFSSGGIAGNLALLSEDLPQMERQLDEMASALVQAFEDADESLGAGAAGLFTDGGNAFNAANLDGLAGRLAVNDAVRPETGGALWRLRDGMGAAAQGPAGDAAQLDAFIRALDTPFAVAPETGLGSPQRLSDYAASMVGDQQKVGVRARADAEQATVSLRAFESARGEIEGVNVDQELQKLLEIEQAYSANAKVLSSLSSMVDDLLAAF
ncbi:flagellar hook-associated protein FlgK [Palleronia pelagia]|uniref:Flagellar hook-associated protein 1 n=1 Tax=Palleronia pelagia TaxID=387096 RepID=A0A1H8F3F5_9RHOB|nr:flagellar hook-associated protein FlgK [Palleronia pelagia]SEN26239.1 flagellar hook-associated protein 1 FlgK [Palleronia pelagia]